MQTEVFDKSWLSRLWRPTDTDTKFGAGQVTIVGGSSLFHGAPILALRAASRLVSMVYFATPEADRGAAERLKASLGSFIWIPIDQVSGYVAKSDAILIGPGMMRNRNEGDGMSCDQEGKQTKEITMSILSRSPEKKYVIDGGGLQVIQAGDIPKGSIITPNRKEFFMLFREEISPDNENAVEEVRMKAKEYGLVVVHKAPKSVITDGERVVVIEGGNPGLVKGGVGDVVAGLAVGFLAKNEPVLAAAAAVYLVKKAADRLNEKQGFMFNADDLSEEATRVFGEERRY